MPSHQSDRSEVEGFNLPQVIISNEILLSLATAPLLAGVLCGKAILEFWQGVGEASEEAFRGDRLPIIKFPDRAQQEN